MGSINANHGGCYDDEKAQRAVAECESFTFMSCSDFASSSLRFFSDSEGDPSDSDSFIEIKLDRTAAKLDSGKPKEDEEVQLRISISSTVPFPNLCPAKNPGVEFSGEGIGGRDLKEEEEEGGVSGGGRRGGSGGGGAKFAGVLRLLGGVATSLKVSTELAKEAPKATRARNGARVMQYLFKFRAMQFRTFLASLVKNRPVLAKSRTTPSQSSAEMRLEETLCFHHRTAKRSGRKLGELIASDKITQSCPGSIKCSPINQESFSNSHTGECSIQAAIAHCKKSFISSHDFSFKSQR